MMAASMSEASRLRVMRILTRPNLGGPTRQAIALWHAHLAMGHATLLVTGRVDAIEGTLSPADHGVPRLAFAQALELGPGAAGWVEVGDLGRGVQPLRDSRAGRRLRQLMAAHRPDVVHTHTSKAGLLGRRAAFAMGVPTVVHTFHGHVLRDYFGPLVSRWLLRLERRLAARTTRLVAVSASCADELAELGVAARERFVVVPPAVPRDEVLPRDEARRRLGLSGEGLCVVAVGRFVPIKRLADFVAMIGLAPELCGDLVGDGPERAALQAMAERQAPRRIGLRGDMPGIRSLLPAYDALVLTSVREGCPLVAVEAFAAGIPVVGYDVPGVRDVLSQWGRGILVPEASGPAGLAAALRRLAASPELRRSCVEGGLSALPSFSPAEVARQLVHTYRQN